ncbi:WbqC family protein [Methanosarcina sp.]|uniref:WbqC family protein n=1 Tax=Methanosarcina sp. TaxID=2213 RepID=UPI003BB66386
MKACIHQPNYLPYIGFFNKIKNTEVYVLFDIAQYEKNKFCNRNQIRTENGSMYLTIPVLSKDCYLKRMCDVKLPPNSKWMKKHWKAIEANYAKSEYFDSYKDPIEKLYQTNFTSLVDFNEEIIKFLINEFCLESTIIKSTDLNLDQNLKSTDLLINILKEINAASYLSGSSGKNYLNELTFKKEGIKLEYQHFTHPVYKQRFNGFVENMAAFDLLFNIGEKSKQMI